MMVFVVAGVAIIIFTIMYFVPGDPASIILGSGATPDELAYLREKMGLNDPFLVQLGRYLYDILHLDFGDSYVFGTPVIAELKVRMPRTLLLSSLTIIIQTLIGIPLGITAAVHAGQSLDRHFNARSGHSRLLALADGHRALQRQAAVAALLRY